MKLLLPLIFIGLLTATACQQEPENIEVESLELIPCMNSAEFFELLDTINSIIRIQTPNTKTEKDSHSLDDFSTRIDSFEMAFPLTARLRPNLELRQDGKYYLRESSVMGYAHVDDTTFVNEILNQKEIKDLIGINYKTKWVLYQYKDGYCRLSLLINNSNKLSSEEVWTSPILISGDEFVQQNISLRIVDELQDIQTYDLGINLVLRSIDKLSQNSTNLLRVKTTLFDFYGDVKISTDTQNLVFAHGLRRQDLKK